MPKKNIISRNNNIQDKASFKRMSRRCRICGEGTYATLSIHRIKPGKEGGAYKTSNSVVLCENCHRKEQNGLITIIGWVHSTAGNLLHYVDEDGKEQFT